MRHLVFTFILAIAAVGSVYALAADIETVVRQPSRPVPQAANGADHAMRGNPADVIRRVDELLPPVEPSPSSSKEAPAAVTK